MKVRELKDILEGYDESSDVVIETENGFAFLDKVVPGIFTITNYGNDFHPWENMTISFMEGRALCLRPEWDSQKFDGEDDEEDPDSDDVF